MPNRLMIMVTVILAACGATSVPDPGADQIVIVIESSGGCAQLGPNCARTIVYGDGTVETHRIGPAGPELVDTGAIAVDLVVALHRTVVMTDLAALRTRLPEGQCLGCVDGIDTSMTFFAGEKQEVFSSVDVELDPIEPVFEAAWAVADAARAATEIPIVAR
jgi:hypothetical protein